MLDRPVMDWLPSPEVVRDHLREALRETKLLRQLLRVAEKAEDYRACDRRQELSRNGDHAFAVPGQN